MLKVYRGDLNSMVKVSFVNEDKEIDVNIGITLSEAIRKAGLLIETPCNCKGLCGKCLVKVQGDLYPPSVEEIKFLNGDGNIRMACLAKVKGNVSIELLSNQSSLNTINRGFCIDVEADSLIIKKKFPSLEEGSALNNILGIAVDIGTTGLSAYLVNLQNGEILNKVSCLNPQTAFGGDVLSRINYAINTENGVRILKDCIVNKINEIVNELIMGHYSFSEVYSMIIAANTTMLHLFAGVNPHTIAKAPYKAVFLDKKETKARDMGIDINPDGIITMLPSASSYVGADILAGIVGTGFQNRKWNSVFIDIGTNGEIVSNSKGKLAATSTAAGPALEGMNISCGCRAEEGAIDSYNIDCEGIITYTTIGNVKAKGICGSGLIDIAASFVRRGIILTNGRFNSNMQESFAKRLVDKKFYITEDIYISQKDIRQIQLAKGAIACGVTLLLEELHCSIDEVEEIVIAGAFGYHISKSSIMEIGLVPKGFRGKISFVGNSSVEGARLALINKEILKEIVELKDKIEVLELSTTDKFQKYFVQALGF